MECKWCVPRLNHKLGSLSTRRSLEELNCADECGDVGMIPSEDSSGDKQRLGHISKQGNSLLRFLLVEAAQAATRINPHDHVSPRFAR